MVRIDTLEILNDLIRRWNEDKLKGIMISAISEDRTIMHTDLDESSTLQNAYHLLGAAETATYDMKAQILANLYRDDEVAPDES